MMNMNCAVSPSAGSVRRQTTDSVVVTNWFMGDTGFEGFSKGWNMRSPNGWTMPFQPSAVPSPRSEYPTPTGEGRL